MVAWGLNNRGQTAVPAGLTNVKTIAAGGDITVALKTDGTVVAWGVDGYGNSVKVPVGLTNVIAIDTSGQHIVALKADGSVVSWGSNNCGETTVPSNLSNVKAVAAGYGYTVALGCTPEQPAPARITGITPTTYDGNDGKIIGTSDLMEYRVQQIQTIQKLLDQRFQV